MSAADSNAEKHEPKGTTPAEGKTPSDVKTPAEASSGAGLAWAALLLAVLALAAAVFAAQQLRSLQGSLSQTSSAEAGRIERLGGELNARIETLVRQASEQQQSLADMQVALEQTVSSLADMPLRVAQVEAKIASVPGIDPRSRSEFLTSEALYYMRIANAQVSLANEPEVAANALQLADSKLSEVANPALESVRRLLSADIAALRAVPQVDRTGSSFKLQALAAEVYNWPFRYSVPKRFGNELPGSDNPDDINGWERLKAVVKNVASSIVTVREMDKAPEAQLAVVEQAIIVETVRAELQLARLALIDGNDELYQQSLARVAEQSGRYFDTESSAVAAGLAQLAELAELELPGELPDASTALQLMLSLSAVPASQTPAGKSPEAGSELP